MEQFYDSSKRKVSSMCKLWPALTDELKKKYTKKLTFDGFGCGETGDPRLISQLLTKLYKFVSKTLKRLSIFINILNFMSWMS